MSAEGKKLLWISISAVVFVLLVLAAGFWLLSPKKGGAQAPAAISNSAPPKAQDPQDFLSAPPPTPALEQPRNQDGGVIIVYGDKPTLPAAAGPPAGHRAVPPAASPRVPCQSAPFPQRAPPRPPVPLRRPLPAPPLWAAPRRRPPPLRANPPSRPLQLRRRQPPRRPKASVTASRVTPAKAAKVDEYWIQAASFTSRGRADDLKQGLADRGIAALISVKDISGKSWYRVRVGPYSAKAEAEGWMGRLKDLPGCADAYVSKLTSTKAKQ